MTNDTSPEIDATKANADERTFDLTTTNGAVSLLRGMLAGNGWTKKVKQVRRASRLVKRLPRIKPPKDADEDQFEAWAEAPNALSIGEADRDMCKACIKWYIEEGRVSSSESTLVLLDEFGVVEE